MDESANSFGSNYTIILLTILYIYKRNEFERIVELVNSLVVSNTNTIILLNIRKKRMERVFHSETCFELVNWLVVSNG